MKRQWLLFSQVVTVLLAIWFVLVTLKPEWVNSRSSAVASGVTLIEAAPNTSGAPMPGSFSPAAKLASPAVVSIATTQANAPAHPLQNDPWFRFF
jgi:serine protease DegQ